MHVDNNIYLQIALIMLIGLLAKNAILIVEFALDRRRQGMSILWSAIAGSAARLRPILMTTLTTILSMLPMGLGIGRNSEMMQGMALVIIGGLVASTLLTLLLMPTIYLIIDKKKRRKRQ